MSLEPDEKRLKLDLAGHRVSAALTGAGDARGVMVAAHGRVNDLDHPGLRAACRAAAAQGLACLRFNFPYRERHPLPTNGGEAVDSFRVLTAVHKAAAEWAKTRISERLILAGKSLGGRTTAYLASSGLTADGVIFLGYPLHAPENPARTREGVLHRITAPLLFIQGEHDALCREDLIRAVVEDLGPRAGLAMIPGVDHGFGQVGDDAAAPARALELIGRAVTEFVSGSAAEGL